MTTKTTLARAGFFLGTLIISSVIGLKHASASPILGQKIYYEGGSVQVTVLPYEASFSSALYLVSTPTPLFIAFNSDVGKIVTLTGSNLASLGFTAGSQLLFEINVLNTGDTFFPSALGNADNFSHAFVDYADTSNGGVAVFAFEDWFGGGDRDYNDAIFQVSGGIGDTPPISITAVPEPASAILLFFGVVIAACVSHRRKSQL